MTEKIDDPVYRYVGSRLKTLRMERSLKQADLARAIGVSPQQYQKYEDAQSRCSLTGLYKLADALDVDPVAILPVAEEEYEEGAVPPAPSPRPALPVASRPGGATRPDEADLIARLVGAFMGLGKPETKRRIVEMVESL